MCLFVLLLLLSHFSDGALCAVKEWLPDTRFDNPVNWPDHRLPCATQRAVLAGVVDLPVHLQSPVHLAAMVLPRSGDLSLGKGASITIHTSKTRGGLGQECLDAGDATPDVQFQAGERIHWYGADNWLLKSSPRLHWGSVDHALAPVAVPDAERVPCPQDRVVFPDRNFRVDTDQLTPVVRSVEIQGQIYDGDMLSRLRTTSAGRLLVRGDVQTLDKDCADGCLCGNDAPEKMERICLQRAPRCPSDLSCTDPVTPLGNCCPVCGSFLVLEPRGSGFRLGELEQVLLARVLTPEYDDRVQTYVHKTHDNRVQMLFVDAPTSAGRAHALATQLFNYFRADAGKSRHGISSVNLTGSTAWIGYAGTLSDANGGSVGLILGIFFAIVVVAAVVVLAYLRRRNFTFKGHPVIPWARFDEGRVELELGTTPHEELVPTGFANPLSSSPFKEFPEFNSEHEPSSTFANPVFEEAQPQSSASS